MRRPTRGFTLLELLVAVVITLLLAGLLLAVTTNLLAHMQNAQGAATAATEAKLVLDHVERDLQSAIIRTTGGAWLDVTIPGADSLGAHGWSVQSGLPMKPAVESLRLLPAVTTGPPVIADARFGRPGVWLRLVAADYDSTAAATLPAAVAYQVIRQPVSPHAGAPVRYALFREKMSAAATFGLLGDPFSGAAPAELVQPDSNDVIASNVVDFGLWLYSRDAAGQLIRLFPFSASAPATMQFPAAGHPAVADVMVRILTEAGAARIQALEEGRVAFPAGSSAGAAWWAEVEAHSHVFTRRVEIKGVVR